MLGQIVVAALLSAAVVSGQTTSSTADSTCLAVMMVGRHGDRTSKVMGNTQLTTLGKNQVFQAATYFRGRYLNPLSADYVQGVDSDYLYNQIYAAAPNENVLGNTATAFLQGFYPPSDPATAATLTNGTAQFNPLDGYQYVLVNGMTATAPDSIWIKGDQYCPAMTNASKAYYQSEEFLTRQQQLQPFYNKFTPLLAGIFPTSQIGFQSAYGIFDYLNVGYQHNSTIYSSLSTDDLFQLRTLADQQELALVYNPNAPATSIGGQTLGGAILQQLNKTVSGTDKNIKVTYFAASYSVFQALWGITGLVNSSANFQGLPDYASVMSFELRKTASSDLFVRFGFRNGTSDNTNMTIYPLFGRPESDPDTPWFQFVVQMEKLGIFSPGQWCHACVNSNQTFCAAYPMYTGRLSGSSQEEMGGLSNVDAGALGAGVTVAVILGIEGFLALWYVRKRKASGGVGEKALSDTSSDRVAFA